LAKISSKDKKKANFLIPSIVQPKQIEIEKKIFWRSYNSEEKNKIRVFSLGKPSQNIFFSKPSNIILRKKSRKNSSKQHSHNVSFGN